MEQNILELIGLVEMSPSIRKLTNDTERAKAMHKRVAGILSQRMPSKIFEMNEINRSLLNDADSALEFIFNSASVDGVAMTDEVVDSMVDIVARLQTNEEQYQSLRSIIDGLEDKRI
jgi:hypothetical protein